MRRGLIAALLFGCSGSDDEASCIQLQLDCTPQYDPVFDQVWANTLAPGCALSGCHGGTSMGGALGLGDEPDGAHTALIDGGWVVPSDPECSPLMEHLEPTGSRKQMPPGDRLVEAELCAVRQWIADGAVR